MILITRRIISGGRNLLERKVFADNDVEGVQNYLDRNQDIEDLKITKI